MMSISKKLMVGIRVGKNGFMLQGLGFVCVNTGLLTLVHDDFEKSVHHIAKKYNIEDADILTEQEIKIPEWNVRGFFDVVIGSTGVLYDIKTANSYKFKTLFGRSPDPNPANNVCLLV